MSYSPSGNYLASLFYEAYWGNSILYQNLTPFVPDVCNGDTVTGLGSSLDCMYNKAYESHRWGFGISDKRSGWVIGPSQRPLLDKYNNQMRQTSMPPVGFEPAIPSSERPKTDALHRAVTGIGIPSFGKIQLDYCLKYCWFFICTSYLGNIIRVAG
jgi:hypothetical protein